MRPLAPLLVRATQRATALKGSTVAVRQIYTQRAPKRRWQLKQLPVEKPSARLFHAAASSSAKDYYSLLGVGKQASDSEIKKAYYKLAKKYHPDANPGKEAATTFADISEAYETLSDPEKRSMYDQFGTTNGQAGGWGGGAGPFGAGQGGFTNPQDIFEQMFGQQRRGGPMGPQRGPDAQVTAQLSFREAVEGVRKDLTYRGNVACDACRGTGASDGAKDVMQCPKCGGTGAETAAMGGFMSFQHTCGKCAGAGTIIRNPCQPCGGRGVVETIKTVSVDIPAGVDDGTELRVSGNGDPGPNGGPAGNLYVLLRVKPSPYFKRDGANLFSEVNISLAQSILGGEINAKTVKGDIKLKVKPGTMNGDQVRLPGRGLRRLNTNRMGDQFITFNVKLPKRLTAQQKELMKQWAVLELDRDGTVTGLDDIPPKPPTDTPLGPSSSLNGDSFGKGNATNDPDDSGRDTNGSESEKGTSKENNEGDGKANSTAESGGFFDKLKKIFVGYSGYTDGVAKPAGC